MTGTTGQSVDADGSWDDTPIAQAVAAQLAAQDDPVADMPDAQDDPVADMPDAQVFAPPAVVAVLDETQPYGRLVGAAPAHFIQAGSVFGIDKKYLGSAQEL